MNGLDFLKSALLNFPAGYWRPGWQGVDNGWQVGRGKWWLVGSRNKNEAPTFTLN